MFRMRLKGTLFRAAAKFLPNRNKFHCLNLGTCAGAGYPPSRPRCKRRPYLPRQPQAGASFACYSLEASRQKCVSMASLDLPHGSEPSVVMYRASEPRWSPNGVLLFGNERVCGLSDAATLAAGSMKNPAVSIWSNISLQVQGKVSMGIAGPHACRWVRFISG
jgi:hypothetical protein